MKRIRQLLLIINAGLLGSVAAGQGITRPCIDSCILCMRTIFITPKDSGYNFVKKVATPNLVQHIKDCEREGDVQFQYPSRYQDHGFSLTVPGYLSKQSFGNSDYSFYYSLDDEEGKERAVVIAYDFEGRYRQWFEQQVKEGKVKGEKIKFGNREVIAFENFDQRLGDIVFLEHNVYIACYAHDPKDAKELRVAIQSFRWE